MATETSKYIQRKSAVTLPKTTGNIVDTLNVEDKITNAPSINLVQMMAGVPEEGVIEFDGDEIPEGYEEVDGKSLATFRTGTAHVNYTISTAYSFVQIKLETTSIKIGNAFTLNSDGSFTVNKDCTVKMNCNVMTNTHATPIITIQNKTTNSSIADNYSNSASTGRWTTSVISPVLANVNAGDTFIIGISGEQTGSVQVANKGFTYITLEEV